MPPSLAGFHSEASGVSRWCWGRLGKQGRMRSQPPGPPPWMEKSAKGIIASLPTFQCRNPPRLTSSHTGTFFSYWLPGRRRNEVFERRTSFLLIFLRLIMLNPSPEAVIVIRKHNVGYVCSNTTFVFLLWPKKKNVVFFKKRKKDLSKNINRQRISHAAVGCRHFIPSGVICVCARRVRPRRRSKRICCVGVRACCPFAPPRARAASLFLHRSCWRSHVEYCAPLPLFSSFSSSITTNGTRGAVLHLVCGEELFSWWRNHTLRPLCAQ